MHKYLLFILLLLFSISDISAQRFSNEKLDSLLDNLLLHNKAMGSLAVSKGKNKLYERSFGHGYITSSDKVSLSNETRYRIGSITKVFTAVLIFQLIEDGKLSLNTPGSKFFPTLPNGTKITVAHLLKHQSGLYNYTDDWDRWRLNYTSEDEMMAIISEEPTLFEPGTKTEYNNSGYILLGYIIEKLYKKPYKIVLAEKITSKNGLNHTYYGGKVDVNKKEAFSYSFEAGSWLQQPETDMSAANGAGGIVSTAADVNKFMHLLFSNKLIKKVSLDFMVGMPAGEGKVLDKIPFYDETLYGHSGQIDYYQSWALYFPEDTLAITYVSNGYGGEPINTILEGVLHIVFNKPYTIPDYSSIELLPEELEELVGEYSCDQSLTKNTITKTEKSLIAQAEGQSQFQLTAIKGKVLEQNSRKPIPYANIGIVNTSVGTISNADGSFSISVPTDLLNDTLVFSALGYGIRRISVSSLSEDETFTILLTEKTSILQEITVSAEREKKKSFWLGNKYHQGGFIYADSVAAGSAMALLIENKYPAHHPDLTFPVFVEKAMLRISPNTMDEFKVRVRFLEVDSITKLPGKDLFNESLVISSSIKKGWLTFDLSSSNFKIEKPAFFLVFEWIMEDQARLSLLDQYNRYKIENPDKVSIDTMLVRGEKVTFHSYNNFRAGTSFGVSPIQFSLDNYICYYRTNSFGEWKRAPVILAARLSVSNQVRGKVKSSTAE